MTGEATAPLSGLRVIELGQIISGPFVGLILADLGATVVKVERPGEGDRMRSQAGPAGDAVFQTMNRNKRSVTIDLQTAAGAEVYRELAGTADVVIENLGPGVADRLGVGYDPLHERNPGLIYLSLKGFFEGPHGDRASMDVVAEAMSGFMRMTGEPGGKPVRAGTSIADVAASMYGLVGVLLALRRRDRTGEGGKVSSGMFEAMSHWMAYWLAYAQFHDPDPEPLGSSHPAQAVYEVFRTVDGSWLFIGVVSDDQWASLCEVLDRPDLLAAERYRTKDDRLEHSDELTSAVAGEVESWDRDALLERLSDAGIPAAPVVEPGELVDDPHLEAVGLFVDTTRDDGDPHRTLLAPIRGDGLATTNRRGTPALGEHTAAVLAEFGFDEAEIETYREDGAFGG